MPDKKTLWKKALDSGDFTAFKNNPVITKSWERCMKFGINPYNVNNMGDELEHSRLKEIRDKYVELIYISSPIMSELYFSLKGSETAIFLVAPNGYILKSFGDKKISNEVSSIRLVEGANWQEESKGTNAIGTAIQEQKPVHILGGEHFCEPLHSFHCFASPIFDVNRTIIGVLNATILSNQPFQHLMALMVATTKAIETQLLFINLQKQLLYNHKKSAALLDSMDNGIFWVNQEGRITNSNSRCGDIMYFDAASFHGRHIDDVFEMPAPFTELMDGFNNIDLSRIQLRYKQNTLPCQIKPILGNSSEVLGAAVVLENNIKSMVDRPRKEKGKLTFEDIIGNSNAILDSIRLAKRGAATSLIVLITGETGTGKEIFARAIHNASKYSNGPYITINCGAIPETLIESELFGYEEGAFTGAKKGGIPGKFELANHGTIFLDEIGEMPLNMQVKLLRVLQEREIVRVGGTKPVNIDARVIAATNKDLKTEVQKGRFRQDLFYRLNVINIRIPPLREHKEDIIPLANHFLEKHCYQCRISPPAESALINYSWPGNVRELENVIERTASFCDHGLIRLSNLPEEVKTQNSVKAFISEEKTSLKNLEAKTIVDTLKKYNGNCTLTANILGISRTTLYRKMKHLGINKDQFHF